MDVSYERPLMVPHQRPMASTAGWHQPGDKPVVPGTIGLLHLLPYCPEIDPGENIWQYLR